MDERDMNTINEIMEKEDFRFLFLCYSKFFKNEDKCLKKGEMITNEYNELGIFLSKKIKFNLEYFKFFSINKMKVEFWR